MLNMIQKLRYSLSADSGYGEYCNSLRFKFFLQAFQRILTVCIDHICFICRNHLRPSCNLRVVSPKLLIDLIDIIYGIPSSVDAASTTWIITRVRSICLRNS